MTDRPLLQARKHSERPHVLIISDDSSLTTFLSEGLPLGGFWTTVIASGLQALEIFRIRQFDLIVLDWQLGSFGAHELLRRLRGVSSRSSAETPRTHAPVVLITEHPADLTEEEALLLGVNRMLHAPLELEEIVRELHAVFAEWRYAFPDVPLSDDPLRSKR
jgi:two-component system KDP operon response regulator KdpE